MSPLSALQEWPPRRALLWILGVALLVGVAVGWKEIKLDVGLAPYGIVRFELAFSASQAERILESWDGAERAARPSQGGPRVGRAAARASLGWDFVLIPCYALVLFGVTLRVARGASGLWKPLGFWLALGAGVAGLCDCVENVCLWVELHGATAPPGALVAAAGVAAAIKFLLIGLCGFYVLVALSARKWARDLGRLLLPVWLHIGIVLGLGLLLVFVGQTQDVIRALGEAAAGMGSRGSEPRAAFCLLFATLLWASSTWYWMRVLLSFKFDHSPEDTGLLSGLTVWLPRIVGTAPFAFVGWAFGRASIAPVEDAGPWQRWLYLFSALSIAGGVLFFLLVWKRRELGPWMKGMLASGTPAPEPRPVPVQKLETFREFLEQEGMRDVLASSVLLGAGLLFGFLFWPVWLGERIGTAATFLLTACFWIPLASLILYAAFRRGIPLIRYALLGVVLLSPINDTHGVRVLEGTPPPRRSVAEQLRSWHEAIDRRFPGEKDHVLYIVAAEGGGIRAAYWTAAVLGQLQDRGQDEFGPRVFALSGSSGGSLGISTFAAEVADGPGPGRSYAGQAQAMLGQDLLSPTLGAFFFPDLLQLFLPPVLPWDRATAMEQSWEKAWGRRGGPFERDFLDLWRGPRAEGVPSLFLNATLAESGTRAIVSNLRLGTDFPYAQDTLAHSRLNLRLSTATHLSARFPYVSPAATFPGGEHLVDGGYFENSGCATAGEILDVVLRERGALKDGHTISPVMLIVTNGQVSEDRPLPVLSGALIPIETILNTRDARSAYAARSLASDAQHANVGCRHIGLEPGTVQPPLGWMLSRLAQKAMDDQARRVSFEELRKCRDGRCACDDLVRPPAETPVAGPTPP